jgi:mRNA interferase MazF
VPIGQRGKPTATEPTLRRGQVWTAQMDKMRPVVLLSRDSAYAQRERVTVAEVTTTLRFNASTVEVGPRDGLAERSIVNCGLMSTIRLRDLAAYTTTLTMDRMAQVDAAVIFALGLPER